MNKKVAAAKQRQAELNEKILLQNRVQVWKQLQVYGDVSVLADLSNRSPVTISDALNKGEGSLKLLRLIDKYFLQREKQQ